MERVRPNFLLYRFLLPILLLAPFVVRFPLVLLIIVLILFLFLHAIFMYMFLNEFVPEGVPIHIERLITRMRAN